MSRWPKRVAIGLAVLAAVVLGLVGGALGYLNGPAGEARVRDEVLSALKGTLQGTVQVGALELNGSDVVLRDLKLFDPEQRLVVEVPLVRLRLGFGALLRRELRVRDALIQAPRLHLILDERGLNLTRAIAAQHPAPEPEKPGERKPSSFSFALDQLRLEGGSIDFLRTGEEQDVKSRLEGLTATGSASWSGPERALKSTLKLQAAAKEPIDGEVALSADVSTWGGTLGAGFVSLSAPGVEVQAEVSRPTESEARVVLKRARLTPQAATAFLEKYPLKLPVDLGGEASLSGALLRVQLQGASGRARLAVTGSYDLKGRRSDGLSLEVRELDLEEVAHHGPKSNLQLALKAKGGGTSLGTFQGDVQLNVPSSQISGESIGPIELSASADRGRFKVPTVRAVLPGVSVQAHGDGTTEHVSLSGKLSASDLSALAKSLGRLGAGRPLVLAGAGELQFQLEGPLRHPGVNAEGQFSQLRYQDTSAKAVRLTLDMPDVTRPLTAEASVKSEELRAGGRIFRRVLAQVATQGQELLVDASGTSMEAGELSLHLKGDVARGEKGLLIKELQLRYPEATWALQRPARVDFREGISAEPLSLQSGSQGLVLEGTLRRGTVDASVQAQKLDLSKLPAAFVDPSLRLQGLLDAKVHASGKTQLPAVQAKVELQGGRYKEYDGLSLLLDVAYERDRAKGTIAAGSTAAQLKGDFDVPVQGLVRRRREPVSVQLRMPELSIADALAQAGRPEKVTGTASASVSVTGTADDPAVRVAILARNLHAPDHPEVKLEHPNVDLLVETGQDGKLQASVTVDAVGTGGKVAVRSPFTVSALLAKVSKDKVLAGPYELDADLHDLPLELLEAAGVSGVGGKATLRVELQGPVKSPTGTAHLAVRGLVRGDTPAVDLALDATAKDHEVSVALRAVKNARVLADLKASVAAPIWALTDDQALARAPLSIGGTVGPLLLGEWLRPKKDIALAEATTVNATVAGTLEGSGTLVSPRLLLASTVDQLTVGKNRFGNAQLTYRYSDAVSTVALRLDSASGGRLQVDGTAKLDLSLPAVRRGVEPKTAALDGKLKADHFELAALNGLVPKIRRISGKLSADAFLKGTLDRYDQGGWVEWKDGEVALEGYGDFHRLQLRAELTNEAFKLPQLRADAGGGGFSMVAQGSRKGDQLQLNGALKLKKFPIVYEDQLLAIATSDVGIEGDLSSKLLNLRLTLPETHVDLPEVKGKDLQDIDRPDDIVLVKNGAPVDKRRKRLAAGEAAHAAQPTAAEKEPTRRYAIQVDAPRHIFVKSSDLELEGGLSPHFQVDYDNRTRISGDVRIIRGKINALGRKFEVQKDSRVSFSGSAARPFVNVTAVHVNEREQVTVFISVRGEGKDITLKPSSQPPLPESEIYTLLATGRRTLKRGSGASMGTGDAVSILGSWAGSKFKDLVQGKLPIDFDVVSVESGGGEGLTGTKVEVGKYVNDRWYVGGDLRAGADTSRGESTFSIKTDYQLTPHIGVQGEYGVDARSGSADLIWSRDY